MRTPILYYSFIQFSQYLAYAVIGISVVVLAGWQFNIDIFKRVIPGLVAMNPLTAICFIMSAVSLLLFYSKKAYVKWGKVVAMSVTTIGSIKVVGMLIGLEYNIDELLFHNKLQADIVVENTNSMAPNTALCFIIIGLALFYLQRESQAGKKGSEFLSIAVLLISLLSVIGYIYNISFYYRFLAFIPMALHTALCFLTLSIAVLFFHPDKGMISELTTPHAGGKMARKLLLPIFLVPILLGWISLLGNNASLYDSEFAAATFTIGVIILLAIVTWLAAKSLNQADRQRDQNETELENANEELRAQADQLTALNKELESFSYSISHDLRAPLRSIIGFSKILEEDYEHILDQEGKKILTTVLASSEKMNKLIDCLLSFSKLERESIEKKKIDMNKLAQNTIKELLGSHTNNISITIDPLPAANADKVMISLVYQNLISNAIKYSSKKESPSIHIGTKKMNGEAVYFVKDNGAGFDMNYYDKLFGVFQRLHSDREFEGTGIGLATVNRIVQRHGGRTWAEGKIGEGSVFYFTLGN
ncbi:GHKL domain-containing protein [Fulvivirga sp. 29W222]|uniref:histidine kinase n=1 Tax=Fulvivirga marina TaxID=2494733 RepID=A0A937FV48_9BACT|nr:ATP-binding protein [Fulvivirga marina]MBL6445558.1 GHKL domain-containing protein [Fulvivirga marina]